ncbi:MAG: extracellular solute-binding protein [Clostridia bacterium]
MKRIMALVLTLALLLSVAPASLAEAKEPIKLTVFFASTRPQNEYTDMTRQYMIDNLGVDVELIQGDAANIKQQLALLMSSGDMPDIVRVDYDTWREYAAEGAFADMTPYMDKYPDIKTYVNDDDMWNYMTVNDQVNGVPCMLNVPSSHISWIRQDWLDNLGMAVPTTLDEFTEVMRAFTLKDPDGNGKNDTYGFSCSTYTYLDMLLGAFGASSEDICMLNEDNTITTNAISEQYRKGLTYLRDCYKEGIIDPELFTCTYEQAQAKWGRGEMGIWGAWWSHSANAYARFGFGELQPKAKVTAIKPAVGENNQSGVFGTSQIDSVVGVSYLCEGEKLDAAMRLINFQATDYGFLTVQFGVENEFFTWDPQTKKITWYWGVDGGKSKSGYEVTDMECYKFLFHEALQASSYELGDLEDQKQRVLGSNMRFEEPTYDNLFFYVRSDEYAEYSAELKSYFLSSMISFVMGEKSLETDWDEYVKTYLEMGGDKVRQSLLTVYNEMNGTAYTFAE